MVSCGGALVDGGAVASEALEDLRSDLAAGLARCARL